MMHALQIVMNPLLSDLLLVCKDCVQHAGHVHCTILPRLQFLKHIWHLYADIFYRYAAQSRAASKRCHGLPLKMQSIHYYHYIVKVNSPKYM